MGKIAFKFNTFGIITFLVMCGLFYWLCPMPQNAVLRAVLYGLFGAFAFGTCFVIVKRKTIK